MSSGTAKATARAGANIAFIKYWGQADPDLNLPLNNSISMTMDNAYSVTTVEFAPGLAHDSLMLNDAPGSAAATRRVSRQMDRLRALAGSNMAARVVSRNSFPTGAGIASSASGFAALTVAAAAALALDLSPEELSALARLASGSACRSIHGGYVEWQAGTGHADSHAVQIAPPAHWALVDVVAVVSGEAKEVPSEAGHRLASTSPFLPARLATLDAALAVCRQAILRRDFVGLGQVAEADALSLHAVALTSSPSVWYWNCGTQAVLDALRGWRADGLPAYFTIDAGPNVHILTLPAFRDELLARLRTLEAVQDVIVCGPGPGAEVIEAHLF